MEERALPQSHPAVIRQVARLIYERHLPYQQAEEENVTGWPVAPGAWHTLSPDDLDAAYAQSMQWHAADSDRVHGLRRPRDS